MSPSPADTALEELSQLYDRSFQALAADELNRLASLLDRCEEILNNWGANPWPPSPSLTVAQESHGRLGSALAQSMVHTKTKLSKLRRGRTDLKRYLCATPIVGTRLHDEA